MTGFLRRLLFSVGGVGWLMGSLIGAGADSISFTDSWKDSAQTSGGVTTVVSVDNGSFSISLTIPGLGNLTTTQLAALVISASFGDIVLPGDFTNNPTTSLNGLSSTQLEKNNSGQLVEVGQISSSISGNTVTINGSVSNPNNAPPFPIFADQFLGTNGPIVSQKILTLSIAGALTYNLQKIIYITGKGTVTRDTQNQNLNTVTISGKANYTPPTLTFINPAANARLTTNTLTVFTLLKDSGSISNVFFSLNGGDFVAGSGLSSNIWTSPILTLNAGTNIIKAYAIDADGFFSTTQTLAVQYVVVAPLTLNIVGSGTVSPNDNGVLLDIGGSYTLTAKPAKGFGFYFWNVGAAMSNNPTLKFTMAANLVITANFKDITAPTLTITSPKKNAKESNATVHVTGTAADNVGVDSVFVQINGTGWITASGTTSWSTDLPVASGNNTIEAYALDAAGNISKTNTITFTGSLPPDWAPVSLENSTVLFAPVGDTAFAICCSTDSFTRTDTLIAGSSGIGIYAYSQTATNMAELSLTNAIPLNFSNNLPSTLHLDFTSLNAGAFTNEEDATVYGAFSVVPATNFIPASWMNHTVTTVDASLTSTNVLKFTSKTAMTLNGTQTATYTVVSGSPESVMIVVSETGAVDVRYVQLTFDTKTSGHYEVNVFDGDNQEVDETDLGTFTFK